MANNEDTSRGVCRTVAGIASLSGTEEGHLMCDRPAGHAEDKTPGQVAYETWRDDPDRAPGMFLRWEDMKGRQERWERVARAVIAAQHHDTQDHILWTRDDVQQTG